MTDTPPYLAIADDLARIIARSRPGAKLPSEYELAQTYGRNRQTARAALQELERRQLVRRVQGQGTFVAKRIEFRVGGGAPPSWSETVRRVGAEPRVETERIRRTEAARWATDELQLEPGAEVYVLSRRRYVNDEPAGWAETQIVADLADGLDTRLQDGASLYRTLEDEYGLQPMRGSYRGAIELAPTWVARRLGLVARPWTIEFRSRADCELRGCPIEVTRGWLRTDVFQLVVEMNWNRGGGIER
ncbi:MAG: GntR family transcriptional regulator [Solirubrobacterales bacterium]|nr:GntR family transcriptional regulator [Solirubrobacterales bacterium]